MDIKKIEIMLSVIKNTTLTPNIINDSVKFIPNYNFNSFEVEREDLRFFIEVFGAADIDVLYIKSDSLEVDSLNSLEIDLSPNISYEQYKNFINHYMLSSFLKSLGKYNDFEDFDASNYQVPFCVEDAREIEEIVENLLSNIRKSQKLSND